MSLPLDGIRVLDLSRLLPGGFCSMMLADYGAEVIKVAPVPKDGDVQIEPPFHSYGAHRLMSRICCDLKSDAGRESFLRLAATAQVVIESFRPGVVTALGIGYDAVADRNPAIVYCSTSGYGQDGPHAQYAGHDLNYLAVGGFLATTHPRADGGPPVPGATIADSAGGYGGTGVADIMKEAGLTHGGFYAHFDSREAMLAEAADRAGAQAVAASTSIAATAPPEQALQRLLHAYLSKEHVNSVEMGCPVAALGSEMPRQAPEVRRAATRRIKEMIDVVARQSPDWGQPGAHEHALVTVATMVGALLLARAVDDARLSDALRDAVLKQLTQSDD
jgi:AcrR family transcriptional regulator